tara:strand:- start:61 stop:468 length:408 start_codon:yes stop_codon:yes gene_type:complete
MAFKMKSGNSPLFKDIGSSPEKKQTPLYVNEEGINSGDSPLPFWNKIKDAAKNVGNFALGGGVIGAGIRELTGKGDDGEDCDCGDAASGEALGTASEGEEGTMVGKMKEKAAGLFGGEHWKKVKEEKSNPQLPRA